MGDRTHVTLTLHRDHYEEIKSEPWFDEQIVNDSVTIAGARASRSMTPPVYVELEYEEVNYGELGFLHELQRRGIAYESTWGRGGEYREGTEYGRYTAEGVPKLLTLYEGDENPPIAELRSRLTKPIQLVEYIKQYERETTPLPWDNQVEYGKRYLTKRLLKSG